MNRWDVDWGDVVEKYMRRRRGTLFNPRKVKRENSHYTFGTAWFSRDNVYRYRLTRIWSYDLPIRFLLYIMLNPSTATENADDPTIRRCAEFGKAWGYGGCHICNLFAFRSAYPEALRANADPVGPHNEGVIGYTANLADVDLVVAAWGTHGTLNDTDKRVKELMQREGIALHHLGLTKGGHPRHPLYLPSNTKPQKWAA